MFFIPDNKNTCFVQCGRGKVYSVLACPFCCFKNWVLSDKCHAGFHTLLQFRMLNFFNELCGFGSGGNYSNFVVVVVLSGESLRKYVVMTGF